jgi:hypothetical protein
MSTPAGAFDMADRAGMADRRWVLARLVLRLGVFLLFVTMAMNSLRTADAQDNILDEPPSGFFTKLALAHGYQTVKDVFQTDRYKPEGPSTTFKSDVDAIYLVFEILPRENPAHILGQWYLERGQAADKLIYEEGVYLQTSQDSGFLEFPRPPDGWTPGNYKVRIHIGERVTGASQLGTLRFKEDPAT